MRVCGARSQALSRSCSRLLQRSGRNVLPAAGLGPRRQWTPVRAMSDANRIKVGDKLPFDAKLDILDDGAKAPRQVTVGELIKGKRAVLFGLPGAFTSVCSSKHVPQFKERQPKLAEKGVEFIGCVSVNDAYVMKAWAKDLDVGPEKVTLLADGEAKFNEATGLTQTIPGLGVRSYRYSILADDGVVKILNVEEPGGMSYKISGPDHMLSLIADLEEKDKKTDQKIKSP